ncbi:hypothetical protein K474DRAFT_1659384 [Panus rudis PR-1116 ss-1]|nr:hypothetical protein K474DRAFT_1659384 [Panus rudis PR-1116 ss-1]
MSSGSGSSSHRQQEAGPSGPAPLYFHKLPSIRIVRPPQGAFSPQVDERCFTYCTQTISGRLRQAEPSCKTVCLRRVFDHEVKRTLASISYNNMQPGQSQSDPEVTDMKFPLPPEGQNPPFKDGIFSSNSSAEVPDKWHSIAGAPSKLQSKEKEKETRYWQEGWYLWMSNSRWAAQEKMDLMMCDLERQAEWQKYKERANEEWLAYEKGIIHNVGERPAGVGEAHMEDHGHEHRAPTPAGSIADPQTHAPLPSPVDSNLPAPPFPDSSSQSLLIHLPPEMPPIGSQIQKLLAPSGKLLNLTREAVSSGNMSKLGERLWEKAQTPEPFILARNVCKKMWETWTDEADKDDR